MSPPCEPGAMKPRFCKCGRFELRRNGRRVRRVRDELGGHHTAVGCDRLLFPELLEVTRDR